MRRAALLFDLDGTLTDTDHLHFETLRDALGAHGFAVDRPLYEATMAVRPTPTSPRASCRICRPRRAGGDDGEGRGMFEKDTGVNPFDAPPKLKDLNAPKDFGQYGSGDTIGLNFISTTDIIGGNSGSPI